MLSSLNESVDITNKQEQYLQSCCFGMVRLCRTWARDWGTWWEADRCSRCSRMGGNRSSSAVPWRAPAPLGALAHTAPWSAPWRFSAAASLAPGQAGWSLLSVSVTEISHYFTHNTKCQSYDREELNWPCSQNNDQWQNTFIPKYNKIWTLVDNTKEWIIFLYIRLMFSFIQL